MYVIRIHALEGAVYQGETLIPGCFVKSYKPEDYEGGGKATFTTSLEFALKFPSFMEAYHFYRSIPTNRPVRPDGEPNRPLTAFTVEIVHVNNIRDSKKEE